MTLNSHFELCFKTHAFSEPITKIWMKIDPHYHRQRCSVMTVSDSIFFQYCRGGCERCTCFETEWIVALTRSSKVVDFGTNWKRVRYFLLDINSNVGAILPRFIDIAVFLLRRATPPLFHSNVEGVSLGLDCGRCGCEETRPYVNYLYNYKI